MDKPAWQLPAVARRLAAAKYARRPQVVALKSVAVLRSVLRMLVDNPQYAYQVLAVNQRFARLT